MGEFEKSLKAAVEIGTTKLQERQREADRLHERRQRVVEARDHASRVSERIQNVQFAVSSLPNLVDVTGNTNLNRLFNIEHSGANHRNGVQVQGIHPSSQHLTDRSPTTPSSSMIKKYSGSIKQNEMPPNFHIGLSSANVNLQSIPNESPPPLPRNDDLPENISDSNVNC